MKELMAKWHGYEREVLSGLPLSAGQREVILGVFMAGIVCGSELADGDPEQHDALVAQCAWCLENA